MARRVGSEMAAKEASRSKADDISIKLYKMLLIVKQNLQCLSISLVVAFVTNVAVYYFTDESPISSLRMCCRPATSDVDVTRGSGRR